MVPRTRVVLRCWLLVAINLTPISSFLLDLQTDIRPDTRVSSAPRPAASLFLTVVVVVVHGRLELGGDFAKPPHSSSARVSGVPYNPFVPAVPDCENFR